MKQKSLNALAAGETPVTDEERAREAQLAVYGPQCAAWLVRAFKREFKARGAMQFVVYEKKLADAGRKRPQFFFGFEWLRRQKRWHGEVVLEGAKRVYRVYHLMHPAGRALLVSHHAPAS